MAMEEYLPPVVTRLEMDIRDFTAKAKAAKKIIDSLNGVAEVVVKVNDDDVLTKLAAIDAAVKALDGRNVNVGVNATNIAGQAAAFTLLRASIDGTNAGITSMSRRLSANAAAWQRWAATTTAWVKAATDDMTDGFVKLDAAVAAFHPNTVLALSASAQLANARAVEAQANGARAQAALVLAQAALLRAQTTASNSAARNSSGNNGNSGGFFASLPGWAGFAGGLLTSRANIPLFSNALNQAYNAIRHTDSGLPTLISHLFSMTQGWHLAAEAVIETVAVWGPALLTLTAYGAAALPTVRAIALQLQNMNTASTATGRSFESLAIKGESVTKAVKPSVLEAFGIGLYTIQRDSGALAPILSGLGDSIDQIAARASAALTGTGSIWATGAKDAGLLMTAFGDLFGVLGNLTKSVPGYAEVLLGFGTDVLGVAERVTGAISPMLGIFLKLHGAIFYGGLFGTAASWGFAKIIGGITSVTESIASLAVRIGLAEPIIAGLGRALLALDFLGGPGVLAGVGLIAGAIAAVVVYLRAAKSAAADFGKSLQQGLSSADVSKLPAMLRADTVANAQQLAQAQERLAAAQESLLKAQAAAPAAQDMYPGADFTASQSGAVRAAQAAVDAYKASGAQLASQTAALNANLGATAKTLGITLPDALTVAGKAGVTSAQLLGSGKTNLAEIQALVGGYIAQLHVMATGTGTLNSALNALNVTTSTQYQDIQDVTGAYSTWIGIVTGGDSAFTTFEQGQKTLITDLQTGGETVNTTLGKITDKFTTVKSSLNGTSDSALAARQAFDSQTQAAISLYNALATQSAVTANNPVAQTALARAGKDIVAQLLPLARGSAQATAEVGALAEIVGGPAGASFAQLAKWVGNTKGAEADLNKQQQILTITTANLSQAAKALANGLQGTVTQAMVNAIANTSNLNGATQNLANAFSKSHGQISAQVQDLANKYVAALMRMNVPNNQIMAALDALARNYGMSSTAAQKWAAQVVQAAARAQAAMDALHDKTVTVTVFERQQNLITSTGYQPPPPGIGSPSALAGLPHHAKGTPAAASGWAWVGEAGPELVKFRGGETVLPNHVARGYANGAGYEPAEHTVNVYLDGKQIYRSTQKQAVNTQRRTGTNGLSKRTR